MCHGDAPSEVCPLFWLSEAVFTLGTTSAGHVGSCHMTPTWREKTRAVAGQDVRLPLVDMQSPPPRGSFLLQSAPRAESA